MQTPDEQKMLEVSVVIPCLNEADTLAACLDKASQALRDSGIIGEIVVADNGSTDASRSIAAEYGARVADVPLPGYGNALMGGIAAARGRFIIMGDADDSYDFREIPRFVERLRAGYDLVQGCRFPCGGGSIKPGAMPFSHRWLGNPLFSFLARRWFRVPINDIYCGMRGFTRVLYERLDLRCLGMEFATEMIIKASLADVRITEVPITLYQDGRRSHAAHLKTFRDGWRTLRFFLMCSPRQLFLWPGIALCLLGILGYALAWPGLRICGVRFDAHTLLFASVFLMCGYQAILFAVFARTIAYTEGLLPVQKDLLRFFAVVNLERGLAVSALAMLLGVCLLVTSVNQWRLAGFGDLDYAVTMRQVIPGVTLLALGFQTLLSSFLVSMLGMKRK